MAEEISYRRLVLIAGTASTSSFVVSSLLGIRKFDLVLQVFVAQIPMLHFLFFQHLC